MFFFFFFTPPPPKKKKKKKKNPLNPFPPTPPPVFLFFLKPPPPPDYTLVQTHTHTQAERKKRVSEMSGKEPPHVTPDLKKEIEKHAK